MDQIPGAKEGSYKSMPSNVIRSGGEYYISGTQGGTGNIKDLAKKILICKDSGFIATPECKNVEEMDIYDMTKVPKYYCSLHNSNPDKYPVHPDTKVVVPEPEPSDPQDSDEPDEPDEPVQPDPEPVEPDDPGTDSDTDAD